MGCQFEILLNPSPPSCGPDAAVDALEFLEELEARWSVYRPYSEVTRLNQLAFEQPVPLADDLFEMLRLGIQIWQDTQGAFDLTAGPLSKAWGFFRREGVFPTPQQRAQALKSVGSQWLELNDQHRSLKYLQPDMEINLGGIGKGYALDLAADRLGWNGVPDFLFHGGQSSVIARGQRQNITDVGKQGWVVGLTHPVWPGRRLLEVQLLNQALGTSGTSRQHFYHEGKRYGHIFDPRTGEPACGVYSATVIADSAATADALATAFYVMGVDDAVSFCESRPDISLIMVTPTEKRQQIRLVTVNLKEDRWTRLMD